MAYIGRYSISADTDMPTLAESHLVMHAFYTYMYLNAVYNGV